MTCLSLERFVTTIDRTSINVGKTSRNVVSCLTKALPSSLDCTLFEDDENAKCSVKNDPQFNALEMGNCTEECIGLAKLFFLDKVHPGRAMLNTTPDARTEQCLTPWYMSDRGVVNASAACRFPFTYKRRAYWSCTTAGHAISWCATSYHNGLTKQVYGVL